MRRSLLAAVTGGTRWTPAQLFKSGAQGFWYDPSDFSTLFQDAAGTTPVTAVEQPVRLMRDKSGRGNHALASADLRRPVVSARVNLLLATEAFDTGALWVRLALNAFGSGSVANTTATTDPLGGNTADFVQEDSTTAAHAIQCQSTNALSSVAGVTYAFSVAVKAAGRSWVQLTYSSATHGAGQYANFDLTTGAVGLVAGGTASIAALGNGWYRCTFTMAATLTGAGGALITLMDGDIGTRLRNYAGDGTSGLFLWGADLRVTNDGANLPVYQRVTSATDYDTAGFPLYLRFDGTDDCLATGNIDFSASDKVTVCAGVRKLSDAAIARIVELSATTATTDGSFNLGLTTLGRYTVESRGTTVVGAGEGSGTSPVPITNVLTQIANIAAPVCSLRNNQVQTATIGSSQGTGNYGTYPLFIGARNDSTQRFNGRIHQLIGVARLLDDATLARLENWVNSRTRAY